MEQLIFYGTAYFFMEQLIFLWNSLFKDHFYVFSAIPPQYACGQYPSDSLVP